MCDVGSEMNALLISSLRRGVVLLHLCPHFQQAHAARKLAGLAV